MKTPIAVLCSGSTLVLALLAAFPAAAQDNKPRTVSRDELRACMNSEDEIAARRKALQERGAKRTEQEAALRKEADEIKEEERHAQEDQWKESRYKRHVKAYMDKVAEYKAFTASINSEFDAVNQAVTAYNGKCGGISFLDEDKQAILQERAAAAKK
jgi:hypothetical protein